MLNYSNVFAFSVSDNKNEYMLYFKQNRPVVQPDGSVSHVETEDVAQIVLNRDGMRAFKQLIDGVVID